MSIVLATSGLFLALSTVPLMDDNLQIAIFAVLTLGFELVLIAVGLVSGTYMQRGSIARKRQKALDTVQMQQAAVQSVSPEKMAEATVTVPTYRDLLWRNLRISLFFVPLSGLFVDGRDGNFSTCIRDPP